MKQRIVLVGGFLGAGKTTLLLKAAELLERRGIRTGLIMNDQGEDLVDTSLAAQAGREVRDVTGACFCCDLPGLVDAIGSLADADVILAEPVGSCTDIVRTVVHPLQEMDAAWTVAPFTVLVEPRQAKAPAPLAYLYDMQVAEADLLVASKADLAPATISVAASLSAKTGEGVAGWLEMVLESAPEAGRKQVAVDYARYGAAEASLAWLNWSATVTCRNPLPALQVLGPFVDEIRERLAKRGHAIAHLKALDSGPGGYLRVGVCGSQDEVSLEGMVMGDPQLQHRLILNLRAECPPEAASEILAAAIARLPASEIEIERTQCFRPAMPRPSVDAASR